MVATLIEAFENTFLDSDRDGDNSSCKVTPKGPWSRSCNANFTVDAANNMQAICWTRDKTGVGDPGWLKSNLNINTCDKNLGVENNDGHLTCVKQLPNPPPPPMQPRQPCTLPDGDWRNRCYSDYSLDEHMLTANCYYEGGKQSSPCYYPWGTEWPCYKRSSVDIRNCKNLTVNDDDGTLKCSN